MSEHRSRNPIVLDWFNVTYRSVAITVTLGVALILGGAGYWYYVSSWAPARAATREIDEATVKLAEANKVHGDDRVEETKTNARIALDEARSAFAERAYRNAIPAAIRSRHLSMQALELARGDAAVTRVSFVRIEGDVKVKRAGEFAWTGATVKMSLNVGDQIKTSSTGSAQVLYFDGTKTTIEPGSLLEIRDVSEDPLTKQRRVREKLSWGRVQASTQKVNVHGSYHEVATEVASARAEDEGEYEVSHDPESGRSSFSAFEGAAIAIRGADENASLAPGERILATPEGRLTAKEALPPVPRLLSPVDQKVFVEEEPADREIQLAWEQIEGVARYRLMISSEPLFSDPLYDNLREDVRAEIDGTPPGTYFWKVAAITTAGREGQFSEVRRFRVTSRRIRDRGDDTPPFLEITESVLTGTVLIVNGRTEPGAMLWIDNEKNEVYENGSFYAVVRLRKDGWNEVLFVAQDISGNETRKRHRAYVETY